MHWQTGVTVSCNLLADLVPILVLRLHLSMHHTMHSGVCRRTTNLPLYV